MKSRVALLVGFVLLFRSAVVRADFSDDVQTAAAGIEATMSKAGQLIEEGELDKSIAAVTGAFPAASRTTAQSFMLANLLYTLDPKASYALHKQVATALPNETAAQYEWAMEQHRAGEYAGALASYAIVSKARPGFAVVYGLSADCLIHLGKTKEAVAAWKQSEAAPDGSLVDFETAVCAVNSHLTSDRDRANLLAKAKTGDVDAARRLIFLDADFVRDWWNRGPRETYLANDLKVLRGGKFGDSDQLKEVLCAGDAATAQATKEDVSVVLRKQGFLLGAAAKLPGHGDMLLIMLRSALGSEVIKEADVREKWGSEILRRAKKERDPELFVVANFLFNGTADLLPIDQHAWEATGDKRFAESLFLRKEHDGNLKIDDPAFAAALKKYPEDGLLAGTAVRLTAKAGKPMEPALVAGIKAEYAQFSPFSHQVGLDIPRPRAELLRKYFLMLSDALPAK